MSFVDDIYKGLAIFEATAEHIAERLATIGDWNTAGPEAPHEGVVDVVHAPAPRWTDGWWEGAKRMQACAGRIGGPISPWGSVVHTTDMLPDEWTALVNAWLSRAGDGSCATFLIGRDEQQGVLQFAPVTRNANHAGGPGHGVFDTARATNVHPNLVMVGIELHCAGGVRQVGGKWRLVENGAAHGAPLPDADVIPDPQRPGRGWHVVTDYQRFRLAALLAELELVLAPLPAGAHARSTGETPDAFTVMPTARVVTHAQLDPAHRADPWHPTCDWLRARIV